MTKEDKGSKCLSVIRIRGIIRASREIRETLKMLRLTRNNYAVVIDDRPSFLGMLKTGQNFVTWGEPSKDVVNMLIKKRGRLLGNKKITDEDVQKMGYKSLNEFAEAIFNCRIEYWKLPNICPVFKLHPPKKGFKGKTKKGYGAGGEVGYRGEKINQLLERMI